jgi:hypothetical protein
MSRCSVATFRAVRDCHEADGRMPARCRGACRHRLSHRPATRPPGRSGFASRPAIPSTRCPIAISRWNSWRLAAICATHHVAAGRGDRHLVDAAIRLRDGCRMPFRPARRSCRRRKTRTRPNWCAPRPAASTATLIAPSDRHEGAAAGLFEGHAGRQGSRSSTPPSQLELSIAAMTGMVSRHGRIEREAT